MKKPNDSAKGDNPDHVDSREREETGDTSDTDRLDWILEQSRVRNHRIQFRFCKTDYEGGEPYFECLVGNNFNSDYKACAGATMREAIDAARDQSPDANTPNGGRVGAKPKSTPNESETPAATSKGQAYMNDPEYPEPTKADLDSPLFEAIWQAIKTWDISIYKDGLYSGPTGNDVMHIIKALPAASPWVRTAERRPTEKDGDDAGGEVIWRNNDGSVISEKWDTFPSTDYWMPIPPLPDSSK